MPIGSTKNLPDDYSLHKTLDLSNRRSLIILNLIAIVLLFPLFYIFDHLVNILRPELTMNLEKAIDLPLINLIILVALISLTIILHELIHGVFFWIYTREIPEFAFKGLYAYAAAPEWYIPKSKFVIVGLSPSILITTGIILLMMVLPSNLIIYIFLAGIFNVSGSLGDFFIIGWIFTQPKDLLVRDSGDSFSIYTAQVINSNQ